MHWTDEVSEVRCGWPVWRSAWQTIYCPLYVGHTGECKLPKEG